ncbi:hypothetical protein M413DRAFT_403306 [Hebeloma cylindrosporum]|uniref:Uncharacterized protein n=1 Tax=Hebeloma cylindrosporum TaxID=76867 RepID=A0A0C3CGV1_HEBCY|nr:hypothetical protein M413DRAFT_403306 [Hebeloma cylindrosporum h7]
MSRSLNGPHVWRHVMPCVLKNFMFNYGLISVQGCLANYIPCSWPKTKTWKRLARIYTSQATGLGVVARIPWGSHPRCNGEGSRSKMIACFADTEHVCTSTSILHSSRPVTIVSRRKGGRKSIHHSDDHPRYVEHSTRRRKKQQILRTQKTCNPSAPGSSIDITKTKEARLREEK